MRKKFSAIIFFFLSFFINSKAQQNTVVSLNNNWQFRKAGDLTWLTATVPGTIHTDLLNNRLIPDPFYSDNEKKLQWIDTCDWEYQTYFDLDENQFSQSHLELQFEGLDTYAMVYLNDSLILTADNMFRAWKKDCKKWLIKNHNHLFVHFQSATKKGKELASKFPYTLPGDEKVFTRKAAYQYGWDWGPRFVTCGIWRPVKLVGWDDVKIESVQIHQLLLTDSIAKMSATINVYSNEQNGKFAFHFSLKGGSTSRIRTATLLKELNSVTIPFEIKNPKRWWCNGYGAAFLYSATFSVSSIRITFDSREVTFGLRTLELVQEKDSSGRSFYFRLNGVPVFMKGANYIPPDNFLPQVSTDRYKDLIQSAVDANVNMLRVWGGGTYEDDRFYSLCDKNGILIWQDFMFACAMYPGDSAFINNIREEARDNVVRLRNHPCIALWCGNNEINEGWKNWEWQKQYHYAAKDSAMIWKDYLKIFHEVIPQIVSSEDGTRPYHESSPEIGWGHEESLRQGDSHYWGVWWGNEPFEVYNKKVGRFMSEYGFQGMPSINTFKTFCDEKDLSLNSVAVKNHQKHPVGYETIQKYLEQEFRQPKDFENYIYVSQLLQAKGVQAAMEAHRRAKSYCMGTLYWQLNDCWPVTSWSSIDYYGCWKALHYAVTKSYNKHLLSLLIEDKKLKVYFINDELRKLKVKIKLQLMDFNGNVGWAQESESVIDKNSSAQIFAADTSSILKNQNSNNVFLYVSAFENDSLVADKFFYFVKEKDLLLPKPHFNTSSVTDKHNISILTISSDVFAKSVFISFYGKDIRLSNNFFDMIPNKSYELKIKDVDFKKADLKNMKLKSLVDTY